MKKSILFLINLDTFFVSHRLDIGKKLLDLGYEVHVACKFIKYEKKLLNLGFKIHKINFKRKSFDLINFIGSIISILIILLKIKPQILHIVSIRSIVLGGLASLFTSVNSIVFSITGIGSIYIQSSFSSKIRFYIVNFLLKIIFKNTNSKKVFIFQNKDDLKFFKKLAKIKRKDYFIIKGSGIKINKNNKYLKIQNKVLKVLMASRLIADKGVYEYIDAAKLCRKLKLNFEFLLIGDTDPGNPSNINIKKIKKLHKQKILKYLPYQNNILKFIRKSSIVVLPSYREGFPKVLIEAASQGRPVITTNVPGCRDAVVNRKTGFLIPVKNSTILAKTIIKLSSNKKLLNQMGKNSLKYAIKNFNINDVVHKHIKIYQRLF